MIILWRQNIRKSNNSHLFFRIPFQIPDAPIQRSFIFHHHQDHSHGFLAGRLVWFDLFKGMRSNFFSSENPQVKAIRELIETSVLMGVQNKHNSNHHVGLDPKWSTFRIWATTKKIKQIPSCFRIFHNYYNSCAYFSLWMYLYIVLWFRVYAFILVNGRTTNDERTDSIYSRIKIKYNTTIAYL